ncbi:MAG TPA: hypothetical protein PLT26_14275, partial [Anaerolineaceae bacterium]|nr:hypothetical protein [Anaerolineaceae bacterium]HQH86717.1 hypothetical protein [Anaerolineaceae bacterium]
LGLIPLFYRVFIPKRISIAFIPNPLFDAAGMIAGALKMPLWRFLIYCWIGKCLKMLAFALGGAALIDLIPWL